MAIWDFLIEHYFLTSAFVVVLMLLIANELKHKGSGAQITCQQAIGAMNHEEAVVVDVRTRQSFSDGHIIHALNLPEEEFERRNTLLNKHKSKPIIVVCDNGVLSGKMAQKIQEKGFEKVFVLAGGMGAWRQESFPVTKG